MKFLVYSLIDADRIRQLIGIAEYSYYYVLQEFLPLLQRHGEVVVIRDPEKEVDSICRDALAAGEKCVFFSFTTPHSMPRGLVCPTVVVFAWEYDTLPNEVWNGNDYFDWVGQINAVGAAITHSSYTARSIEKSVNKDVVVGWMPAPLWDRMQKNRRRFIASRPRRKLSLSFSGQCLESRWLDYEQLDIEDEERRRCLDEGVRSTLDVVRPFSSGGSVAAAAVASDIDLSFAGVIYVALLNPYDGRKNWQVMIEAFCLAFRDVEDATLLIKVSASHLIEFSDKMMDYLRRLSPFKCRVTLIQGYLSEDQYTKLIHGATYYVNTSFGEGQCLPLMEFMSCGVPAIAPRTTALQDYIRPWNAFVLKASPEPASWQHDPRQKFRARHFRVEYQSLERDFRRSYVVARRWRWRLLYHFLQFGAVLSMGRHCSMKVCEARLVRFLERFSARHHMGEAVKR